MFESESPIVSRGGCKEACWTRIRRLLGISDLVVRLLGAFISLILDLLTQAYGMITTGDACTASVILQAETARIRAGSPTLH